MNKPQWITLSVALLIVIGLFAATQGSLFGERKAKSSAPAAAQDGHSDEGLSTDSVLFYAKKSLPQAQVSRLAQLENSITRGDVADQKLHLMHQLARFWVDSARAFTPMAWYPYAYYTAEAARLENSEKSLSFAARLFLEALGRETDHRVKHWQADQATDLFERSLKLNPANDSAKIGLGATILYGGHEPMKGISLIREVVEKDSTNTYAHLTLAEASLMSGQLDKAIERLKTVIRLQPGSLQATLLLADTYERMGHKEDAAKAYRQAIPLVSSPEIKKEIEKRVSDLKNNK
ncbi:MAG: tetratricopeptide repeat protein [Chitinophagaceae bacterium]|nr:MAG: tetratricopeptide repeat protein [Chitinophagaceae bacterium]